MELLLLGAGVCVLLFAWALWGELRGSKAVMASRSDPDPGSQRLRLLDRMLLCAEALREIQDLTGESRVEVRRRIAQATGVEQPSFTGENLIEERARANAIAMEMICEIAERRCEPIAFTAARLNSQVSVHMRLVDGAT